MNPFGQTHFSGSSDDGILSPGQMPEIDFKWNFQQNHSYCELLNKSMHYTYFKDCSLFMLLCILILYSLDDISRTISSYFGVEWIKASIILIFKKLPWPYSFDYLPIFNTASHLAF